MPEIKSKKLTLKNGLKDLGKLLAEVPQPSSIVTKEETTIVGISGYQVNPRVAASIIDNIKKEVDVDNYHLHSTCKDDNILVIFYGMSSATFDHIAVVYHYTKHETEWWVAEHKFRLLGRSAKKLYEAMEVGAELVLNETKDVIMLEYMDTQEPFLFI